MDNEYRYVIIEYIYPRESFNYSNNSVVYEKKVGRIIECSSWEEANKKAAELAADDSNSRDNAIVSFTAVTLNLVCNNSPVAPTVYRWQRVSCKSYFCKHEPIILEDQDVEMANSEI